MRAAAVAGPVALVATVQVGTRRVPALARVLRDLVPAHALLLFAVEVVVAQIARLLRGLDKALGEGIGRAQVRHMERAIAAVQRVVIAAGQALIAFRAAEIRQHVVP
ncbi:hypothetical protein D3C72_1693650 [compost metagenome]